MVCCTCIALHYYTIITIVFCYCIDLLILCTRTTGYGPRSFAVAGPRCCNGLLSALKSPSLSISQFCCQLKTVFFCYMATHKCNRHELFYMTAWTQILTTNCTFSLHDEGESNCETSQGGICKNFTLTVDCSPWVLCYWLVWYPVKVIAKFDDSLMPDCVIRWHDQSLVASATKQHSLK